MLLGLSESLPVLVGKRFAAAQESGGLVFSTTQLTTIYASRVPYQLRYCPALAKKPGAKPANDQRDPKSDPFECPPPDLLVAEIPRTKPTYALVLNKFPVIPNHLILATREFERQTDLLEKQDLEAAFACLGAWEEEQSHSDEEEARGAAAGGKEQKKRLVAFFNSGEHSGASQPHRHLQFLPVEAMRGVESPAASDGNYDPDPWVPLIDQLSTERATLARLGGNEFRQLPQLPFMHFALSLPRDPSANAIYETYLSLYRVAVRAVGQELGIPADRMDEESDRTQGPAAISYNLAMTVSTMMICPRRSDQARLSLDTAIKNASDVVEAGLVSLNGTILTGTLMVKAEAEWNELRSKPDALNALLAAVAFPWSSSNAI